MKFQIKNRWTRAVQFECELPTKYESKSYGVQLGAAVKIAVGASADLAGAYLTRANLTVVDLTGADLTDANLARANLSDANLTGAYLAGANLADAYLTPIRDDLFAVLSYVPGEVTALISALEAGRVNGSTYSDGECGCLVGTLAIAAGADPKNKNRCELVRGLQGNSSRPIERFFLGIKRGDTPKNNQFARLAHGWACEWLARMRAAFGYEILVRQDRIEQLERQVDRLKSIASNGWIEAWHCGNQFMALPPDDDHETVLRCWEESQTKRELSKLN